MNKRQEWLEQTKEEAREPEIPICDPHHHFWDYPTSRYLEKEFVCDISGGHRIVRTIFVECLQFYDDDAVEEKFRPIGETRTVDRIADAAGKASAVEVAAGIVGFADLSLGEEVRPVLEKHIDASTRFRGIRYATAWHADDAIHNAHTNPPQHLMSSPAFRAGLSCLTELNLSFDAWLYHEQLPELSRMARDLPNLNIVLNHMAGPLGIGPYAGRRVEEFDTWKTNLTELSECKNVSVKLGGRAMAMSGFGWSKLPRPPSSRDMATAMAPYFETCIELFGAERCMFESNFPVDKASCSYTTLWNAFKRGSSTCSDAERRLLFHDTAVRIYRLDS